MAFALDDIEVIAPGRGGDRMRRGERLRRLAAAHRDGRSVAILPNGRRDGRFILGALRDLRAAGFPAGTPLCRAGPAGRVESGFLGTRSAPGFAAGARSVFAGTAAAAVARGGRRQPLRERRFVVTRAAGEGDALAARLAAAGAEVLFLPSIEVRRIGRSEPFRRALAEIARFDWIVFTSRHAVAAFAAESSRARLDWCRARRPRCAAIGPATARALERAGRVAELVPGRASASSLVAAFRRAGGVAGRRFLLPQSALAGSELATGLTALGGEVTAVAAYDVVTPRPGRNAAAVARLASLGAIDAILLASGSAARGVVSLLARRGRRPRRAWPAIAIGESTARAARRERFRVLGVAAKPGDAALVALAIRVFGARRAPAPASPR